MIDARAEALAVHDKTVTEAGAVFIKDTSAIYAMAIAQGWSKATFCKANDEAGDIFFKAKDDAKAVYAKAMAEVEADSSKVEAETKARLKVEAEASLKTETEARLKVEAEASLNAKAWAKASWLTKFWRWLEDNG